MFIYEAVQRIGEFSRYLGQPPCLDAPAILIGKTIAVSELANMVRLDVSKRPVVGIPAHSAKRNPRESNIEVVADLIG
jgi:hypothetical protein